MLLFVVCDSMHCVWYEGSSFQPPEISNGQHAILALGKRQFPREFNAMGCFYCSSAWVPFVWFQGFQVCLNSHFYARYTVEDLSIALAICCVCAILGLFKAYYIDRSVNLLRVTCCVICRFSRFHLFDELIPKTYYLYRAKFVIIDDTHMKNVLLTFVTAVWLLLY